MYLTKLELPLRSRKAVGAVTDCQKMHRLISDLFGVERRTEDILYRMRIVSGVVQIYLYSAEPPRKIPEGISLIGQRNLSEWLAQIQPGQSWGFDLLTMPSKKVYQDERDQNSRRRVIRIPEERIQWLHRKAEQNGFEILQVQERDQSSAMGRHPLERGGAMYWDSYHYQGTLRVIDAARFCHALETGIGPGKAYGLGMMVLRK